jgi:hypothetical protein
LDYKALKKIVSSVTAEHSPVVEVSSEQRTRTTAMSPADVFRGAPGPIQPLWELSVSSLQDRASPLPPTIAASTSLDQERGPAFQMKKAAFFFKLQRELDKVRRGTVLPPCRTNHWHS